MNEQLIAQVEELGLSNKEARVYVANLMIGPSGVQQIADASGIKRVTTYVILESLVSLGLVSQTNQGKKTLFNAESPENLRRLLEKKEESLKEQKSQLDELLPELKNLRSLPKEAPTVKFYDGADAIMSIYQELPAIIKKYNVRESMGISNLEKLYKFFPEIDYAKANPRRVEAKVHSRFIYTTQEGPVLKDSDKEKLRESRFIPSAKFPFSSDIGVIGNFITILSLEGARPTGVTIESESIAKDFGVIFDLAWEASKKYNRN
ncbi:MAG TPA: helix-turn-helix domain-containing protein [Candidatus Saccharimonadales bacterium]|nr:helix-turn-helix domain-containing protein [Candidatus Saccharimonadales bacterium]